MKLNITPGPWEYSPNRFNSPNSKDFAIGSIVSQKEDWFITEVQQCCGYHRLEDNTESEANAAAIVTAVNNTYHKGINPEAVPDMLDALKMALQTLIVNYPLYKECPEYEFISKAIQKATL